MRSKQIIILFGLCLAFFLGNIDVTAMNLALPTMKTALHMSNDASQWIITGFLLGFATVIIVAGRLSDIFGYKKTFLIGLAIFIISSIFGIFCVNAWQIITCRVVQGIGVGLLWPGIQAITMLEFSKEHRGFAMGILLGLGAGLAMSAGPLIGGTLVELLNWRWIFGLNAAFGVIPWLIILFALPGKNTYSNESIDYWGVILLVITFGTLAYGFAIAGRIGFTNSQALVWVLGALIIGLIFIIRELVAKEPLVDIRVIAKATFIAAVFCRMAIMYNYMIVLFLLSLYFQHVMHLSPIEAGLYLLPMMICTAVLSIAAGKLVNRYGEMRLMFIGMTIVAIGIITFTFQRFFHVTFYTNTIPSIIFGIGLGISFPTTNLVCLKQLPEKYTGLSAGILYTMAFLAGSIGVSISASIARSRALDLILSNFLRLNVVLSPAQQASLRSAIDNLNLTQYLNTHFPQSIIQQIHPSVDHVFAYSFADAGYIAFSIVVVAIALMVISLLASKKTQQPQLQK